MSQEISHFKCEACGTEFKSHEDLLIMKNMPHIEDLDVAGNSNINKNGEMDISFI